MSNFRANLSPYPFGDFLKNILGEKGLINNIMITCLCRARQTGPRAGNPEKPVLNLFSV
jgi:hypothetical protein